MGSESVTTRGQTNFTLTQGGKTATTEMDTGGLALHRLSALDTGTVSDALDFLGLPGATHGLLPLWQGCPKVVGRASTVTLGEKRKGPAATTPTVHLISPVIDAVTADDRVLVVAGGVDGVSCWGDILANAARAKQVRGTVIDGAGRDIDGCRDVGYPVYARGVTMVSARNRVVQVASGEPLVVGGVLVSQDDYVIADRCGTVFVPTSQIGQVLDLGERIARRQEDMVTAVREGRPVSEVMHDQQFEAIRTSTPGQTQDDVVPVPSGQILKKAPGQGQEFVDLFAGLNTPAVSDALDKLNIPGQAINIMPLTDYEKVTIGPAFTVRYVPAGDPPGSVGDFIDDVAPGDFVVIDNGGRRDCTVWGDIMTQYAGLRGIAGTVIDGVCRDVDRAITDDYPLFTTGRWMRTGKDRVEVGGVNEPIGVGGVRVNPRDIVIADVNGVVIVPRHRVCEVAAIARVIEKSETGIREMIAGGATVADARQQLGYHTLQRRT